jgi:hypothetical protein
LIFWTFDLNHRVLLQARRTGGLISMAGPQKATPESVAHYLRLHPSGQDLEAKIRRQAKPWPEVLKQWVQGAEEGQVDDLFLRLEEDGADIRHILQQCGRLKLTSNLRRVADSIRDGDAVIRETPEGWAEERSRKGLDSSTVCNAMLRITHRIKDKKTNNFFCAGEVRYGQEVIRFIDDQKLVREKTAKWLQDLLFAHNVGVLMCSGRFRTRLYEIAVRFHQPKFVGGLRRWVNRAMAEGQYVGRAAIDALARQADATTPVKSTDGGLADLPRAAIDDEAICV